VSDRDPRDRSEDAIEDDRILVEDTGESLDAALEEEEQSAIAAAEAKRKAVERELEELKDRHLRKLAEFDNIRKRNERERGESRRNALADVAREFLPVLDSFERALAHATSDDLTGDFGQGVLLIERQLADLWQRQGLKEVDTAGTFDPNRHEAVSTEPSAAPPNSILEVLRKGYTLGDRLIRPALVKVAVRPEKSKKPAADDDNDSTHDGPGRD
jgi:molecular chaperone GrpE